MTNILNIKVNGQWVGVPALKGDKGDGVPVGGTEGQILIKNSNADYDTTWENQPIKITETYKNGTEWYRIYSDGWCEQGGAVTPSGSGEKTISITLLKPYLDTNYFVVGSYGSTSSYQYGQCYNITASGFTMKGYGGVTNKWMTCGYIN